MKEQNLKNHKRIHPLYHYVMSPLALLVMGLAIYLVFVSEDTVQAIFNLFAATLLVFVLIISRTFSLTLQNRLVRAEMRLRYRELTGESFAEKEKELRLSQIIALRFAGDDELIALINKTIDEKLTSSEIKRRVKNWQADNYRV